MKCTNKEQETCEVEKRGCKGCYYNDGNDTNVGSIEKDIKQLEDLILDRQSFITGEKEHDEIYLKDIKAINNLINDYTRQKQINEEYQKINGELREKIKELEKENKLILNSKIGIDCILQQLRTKTKIKDKLEEINKTYNKCANDIYRKPANALIEFQRLVGKKEILQELLQESEEEK